MPICETYAPSIFKFPLIIFIAISRFTNNANDEASASRIMRISDTPPKIINASVNITAPAAEYVDFFITSFMLELFHLISKLIPFRNMIMMARGKCISL